MYIYVHTCTIYIYIYICTCNIDIVYIVNSVLSIHCIHCINKQRWQTHHSQFLILMWNHVVPGPLPAAAQGRQEPPKKSCLADLSYQQLDTVPVLLLPTCCIPRIPMMYTCPTCLACLLVFPSASMKRAVKFVIG